MRTKIDLLSSGVIDLMDDIPYSLNYAIADIRTPDKRDSSYSKTIRIPGSKVNDGIFKHIWNIDIDCSFNPNIKAQCIISIDGLEQLKGFLQLLKVIKNDGGKLEYEVTIRGQVGNIFTDIGELELTDIDFSDLNHYYLKSVQKASWTTPIGENYVYPLIDLGRGNGTTYLVNYWYPAIYVKEYIDRIFADAGYTYSSTFFVSDFFKRLIIPTNSLSGDKFSYADTQALSVDVTQSIDYTINVTANVFTDPHTTLAKFDTNVINAGGQFDLATEKWTVQYNGVYDLYYSFSTFSFSAGSPQVWVSIQRESSGVFTQLCINNYVGNPFAFTGINGVSLQAGDRISVGYFIASSVNSVVTVNHSQTVFRAIPVWAASEGSFLHMNKFVPKKIKQKDFITSLIKMFNLYIDTDKEIYNQLNIEPRSEFYANGEVVDWTNKLDISRDLLLEPMGQLDSIRYQYSYKEDSDYWNKKYKDAHREVYSEQNLYVNNDFINSTTKTEIIFSPTPNVQFPASSDRAIPQILSLDQDAIVATKDFNIRILYYGGVKSTANSYTYTSVIEGNTTETTYPYCGMIDVPELPDMTLDFGVPSELYYNTLYYSNNNLYNKYYKQFIEEISDKDSKIVTGWFALTPVDVLKLDFRNQFYVAGHMLRLNKIFDYNPVISQMTKCEFIKIKTGNAFERQTKPIGAADIMFPDLVATPRPVGGNRPPFGSNVVKPDDNYVAPTSRGVIVTGSRNMVGDGCENVTILNSSGVTVLPNMNSVVVLNSSGITVTESNSTYQNGYRITPESVGRAANGIFTALNFPFASAGVNPANSNTYYFGLYHNGIILNTFDSNFIYFPLTGRLIGVIIQFTRIVGTADLSYFYIHLNSTTDYLVASYDSLNQSKIINMSMAVSGTAGVDYINLKWVTQIVGIPPTNLLASVQLIFQ